MTDSPSTSAGPGHDLARSGRSLLGSLQAVKRRMIGFHLARALVLALTLGLSLTLLIVGVDAALGLGPRGRLALLVAAGLGFAAAVLWYGIRPLARAMRLSRHRLAHMLERHFPQLESRVVTVLELDRKTDHASGGFDRQMTALAIESASAEIDRCELAKIVSPGDMKRAFQGLAAAGALAGVLFLFIPGAMSAGLHRFTTILHELRLERAYIRLSAEVRENPTTRVIAGDRETVEAAVIEGTPLVLDIEADSSEPAPVLLHRRRDGQTTYSTRSLGEKPGEADLGPVAADTEFYFTLGKRATRRFEVTATDYPTIETVQIRYHFPAYTRMASEFLPESDGRISVVHMTEAEVTVIADKPLRSGVFSVYGRRVKARVYGRRASVRFQVTGDGQYRLDLTDTHGFPMQETLARSIESVADRPPVVQVEAPEELLLTPDRTGGVRVKIEAQDDYGVAAVKLKYELSQLEDVTVNKDRDARVREREHELAPPQRQVRMAYPAGFGNLELAVGEVLTYWVEVEDADDLGGPHKAASRKFRIVVVAEALQRWSEIEDEDRWPSSLRGLLGEQAESRSAGIQPPKSRSLVSAGEKPRPTSGGISDAAEGHIPRELRDGLAEYSSSLNEEGGQP